ncbi:helix-turn-helix domain-containing protein [Pantoea agglomerans]
MQAARIITIILVAKSQKELDRIPVLLLQCDKQLTQSRAAKLLDLSIRQVQRLLSRYQTDGATGLSSQKSGKPANNQQFCQGLC